MLQNTGWFLCLIQLWQFLLCRLHLRPGRFLLFLLWLLRWFEFLVLVLGMAGGIRVFLGFLTVVLPVLLRLWTGHVMVRWFLWNLRSLVILLHCGGIWWLLILHLIRFLRRLDKSFPVLRSLLRQSSLLLLRRFWWILLRWSYVLLQVLWLLLICHSISAVHWHG